MVDTVPPWLESMRADLGVEEIPGSAVNPRIIAKARLPGVKFPDVEGLVAYGLLYNSDDEQAWCGAEAGGCLAEVGIMPPFGPRDTDRYFWAASFRSWGVASDMRVGAIACYDGHVNFVDEIIDADTFWGIGGNQGSPKGGAVTRSKRNRSSVIAFRRPDDASLRSAGLIGAPTTTLSPSRPLIKLGASGGFVTDLQKRLGLTPSGAFDQVTDLAVRAYQRAHGLDVDGEVGPDTWGSLLGTQVAVLSDVPHGAEYLDDWQKMTILPAHAGELETIAHKLLGYKARYQAAVAGTGVPWFFVAVIHQRESSASFSHNIHNGQPLNQVTTIAPSGRGPFSSFEASVHDWIALKGLDKIAVWSIERFAYQGEANNGMGYRNHGVPSAYLWSFSNIYRGGKYIADGPTGWSPTTFDQQCGTMPMVKQMMALDASIVLAEVLPTTEPPIDGEILDPLKPGQHEPPPIDRGAWGSLIAAAMLYFMELKMTGQVPDLSKLFELIENPVLHKLFSGGAVTRAELRTLPGAVLATLGHSQPALPAPATIIEPEPVKQAEPVKVEPAPASVVVTPAPSGILPGLAGGLSITGLIAYLMDAGTMGTPFGMGQAPTSGGSLGAIIGALSPVIGAATGSWWVKALGKVGPILSAVRAASKAKT